MIVTHHLGKTVVKKRTNENPAFLLANKKGGFVFLGPSFNYTKFQGAFFSKEWDIYKVIEKIDLIGNEIGEVRNNFFNVERIGNNCIERFFTNHTDTLFYEVKNFKGLLKLTLDAREIYDFSDIGRIYKISEEKECILIEYIKYKDKTLKEEQYKIYLAIKGYSEFEKIEKWVSTYYEFDKYRGSNPFDLYVFEALNLKINKDSKLIFSYGDNKEEALYTANHVHNNYYFIKKSKENYINTLIKSNLKIKNNEVDLAYKNSIKAMDNFLVGGNKNISIYAGFLWFTQVWTRDEAISLIALLIEERYEEVKIILFRQIENILPDGRIPNRFPHSKLGSCDGVGWVFKRVYDFLQILEQKGRFHEFISPEELIYIKKQLKKSIELILENYGKNGFIHNKPLETWMDTDYKDDTRSGVRIEIQALHLNMYKLMKYLCSLTKNETKKLAYDELMHLTSEHVKKLLWKNPILYDGKEDPTIRPNIFIAYYVYPELLSKKEWIVCFDNALKQLFLSWGGISSIDKNHSYFSPYYTGQDNKSYHRGDSWFFLNNLTAICLHKLDKKRYKNYISKILEASTEEILFKGIIGFHSELSPAQELKSVACLAQAWSSAMYIELINEIFNE